MVFHYKNLRRIRQEVTHITPGPDRYQLSKCKHDSISPHFNDVVTRVEQLIRIRCANAFPTLSLVGLEDCITDMSVYAGH